MHKKSLIIILLILAGCATQRHALSHLTLNPLNNDTLQNKNYVVAVDFSGIKNQNYAFDVSISNHSNDSIIVQPSLFRYEVISGQNITSPQIINGVNPYFRISELKVQISSLIQQENPYSLTNKSTKDLIVSGLISGTINAIFGISSKEAETQRQQNEVTWNQNHKSQLKMVSRELHFWNTQALLPQIVAPDSNICGIVLFPVSKNAKEIQVNIPIKNDTLNFRFAQLAEQMKKRGSLKRSASDR